MGHKFSANGVSLRNDKVAAIKNLRQPNRVEELRSFLGLLNFVGKFIPDLATATDPLRKLTKKGVPIVWDEEKEAAFYKLKAYLQEGFTLGYFNKNDRTQVYADASPVGLGAVLVQFDQHGPRIICYASKSLSGAEKRYCQTEKEALSSNLYKPQPKVEGFPHTNYANCASRSRRRP